MMGPDYEDADSVQVSHLVPGPVRDDAQEASEHGELSDMVRAAYRVVAYGDGTGAKKVLELEKRQIERERRRAEKEKREKIEEMEEQYDSKVEELEEQKERIQERLEDVEDVMEQYNSIIDELEGQLHRGIHVSEHHGEVKKAAKVAGKEPYEVIGDLKERNPEVPSYAFVSVGEADEPWDGLDS